MKKKLGAILLSLIVALSALSFVGCHKGDGGVVDTFVGKISDSTYDSEQTAVEAFFENELAGEYIEYEVKSTLNEGEIKNLITNETDRENIESVKKVEVKFTQPMPDEVSARNAQATGEVIGKTKSQIMYILIYSNGMYKYFTPRPEVGEAVSYSYAKSIFDANNYKNCKVTVNAKLDLYGEGEGDWYFYENIAKLAAQSNVEYYDSEDNISHKYSVVTTNYVYLDNGIIWDKQKQDKVESGETIHSIYVSRRNGTWNDFLMETFGSEWLVTLYPYMIKTVTGFEASDFALRWLNENEFDGLESLSVTVRDGRMVCQEMVFVGDIIGDGNNERLVEKIIISDFGKVEPIVVPQEFLDLTEEDNTF